MKNLYQDLLEEEVSSDENVDNMNIVKLTENILSVVMSSSYAPGFTLGSIFRALRRNGKEVTVYSNNLTKFVRSNQPKIERQLQRANWALDLAFGFAEGNGLKAAPILDYLPANQFNHLKAIVITKQDESRVAYISSSTFHEIPVACGTAEVALRTTDDAIIDELETFVANNLAFSQEDRPNEAARFGLRDLLPQ